MADEISMEEQDDAPEARGQTTESMRVLEALVFASSEPMPIARLKELLPDSPDVRVIRSMVRQINENLQVERHPFEIVEIGGGYQFRTVSYYQPWVQQLFKEKTTRRLSIQSLECLAIIAYRQPITKAEIEAVRGVTSDGAMKTLLERRLITIAGRSEKAGRPLLYGTTQMFLNYFGLNKTTDLPRIEEFEAMAREKMEDLSEEELQQIESLPPAEGETGGDAPDTGEQIPPSAQQHAVAPEDSESASPDTANNESDTVGAQDRGESEADGDTPNNDTSGEVTGEVSAELNNVGDGNDKPLDNSDNS